MPKKTQGDFNEADLIKLRAFLRQQAAEQGLAVSKWAQKMKLSQGAVSEFLNGKGKAKGRPGPKLLKALGFRLVWTIEPTTRGRPPKEEAA